MRKIKDGDICERCNKPILKGQLVHFACITDEEAANSCIYCGDAEFCIMDPRNPLNKENI